MGTPAIRKGLDVLMLLLRVGGDTTDAYYRCIADVDGRRKRKNKMLGLSG